MKLAEGARDFPDYVVVLTTDVHNTCQMTFCKKLDNYIIEIYGKMRFNPCRIKSRWLI